MQDHEFEKQVHQKMEEIKILPSDAVWKEVERRLHPKSKSRRWLWFPFLLIALGIGSLLMYRGNPASQDKPLQSESEYFLKKSSAVKPVNDNTERKEKVNSETTNQDKQVTVEIAALRPAKPERNLSGKKNMELEEISPTIFPVSESKLNSHVYEAGKPDMKSLLQNDSMYERTQKEVVEILPVSSQRSNKSESLPSGLSAHITDDSSYNIIIKKEPVSAPVHPSTAPAYPINTSMALGHPRFAVNAPAKKQQKSSKWEWGLTLHGGQSGITNGNFTRLFVSERVADVNNFSFQGNSFPNFASSGNPFPNSSANTPPSALKPGFGFTAGVFVKKQLTRRTSISAGLQYTRFSTSHKVGKRITDTLIILRNSTSDQKTIEEHFRLGNTDSYINKYHFIGLPVLFETRLTGNRFVPVYWDIGFSFSRLVSSNALHFNGNSRIYYNDNSLFNRNQFSFLTGLPVRILSGDKFSLKAGPLFQYGISKMIDKERSGSKHILFTGLKADITLFK